MRRSQSFTCALFHPTALVCAVVLLLVPASQAAFDGDWLTVIHTSDIQSHLDESGASPRACTAGAYCYGGVARLVQLVKAERAKGENVLVLDAGGLFNTALLGNPSAPELLTDVLRLVGYDAMALGQPELIGDLESIRRYMTLTGGPFVCTAGLVPPANASGPACNASLLISVGSMKVGVVSYLAPDIAELQYHPPPSEIVSRPLDLLNEETTRLRSRGAQLIFALVYTSYSSVRQNMSDIAHALTDVDLVVAGNAGVMFFNGPAPHGEVVGAPYPAVWPRAGTTPLLAVNSHAMLHYAGILKFKVSPDGKHLQWSATNPSLLTGEKDPAAEEAMANLRPSQDELLGGLVARSVYMLEGGAHCRAAECVLGTMVADAMLEATIQPEYKGNDIIAWTRAGTVIYEGSVVRATISPGLVREEDLRVALPLNDPLVIVSVLGRLLVDLLENSVRAGIYRNLQTSGLRLGIVPDPDAPGVMRVHTMKVLCTVCQMPAFKNINHRYTYRIVSTESCVKSVLSKASGGLRYEPLNITLRDAAKKLMRKLSPMAVPREQRITRTSLSIHEVTGAAARTASAVLRVTSVVAVSVVLLGV